MKKKAFITGISGQDGSYLAEYLVELGYEVHGIVRRNSTPEHQDSRITHLQGSIETYYGDLLDQGGLERLLDNEQDAIELKKLTYDGRVPDIPWRKQNISSMGYHYYMTPETAAMGLEKLPDAVKTTPRQWVLQDWPDLTQMEIFNNKG